MLSALYHHPHGCVLHHGVSLFALFISTSSIASDFFGGVLKNTKLMAEAMSAISHIAVLRPY
jgi:hypothetical protein